SITFDQCGKMWPPASDLKGHYKTAHAGETPVACDVCGGSSALSVISLPEIKEEEETAPDKRGKQTEHSSRALGRRLNQNFGENKPSDTTPGLNCCCSCIEPALLLHSLASSVTSVGRCGPLLQTSKDTTKLLMLEKHQLPVMSVRKSSLHQTN
ncbi:hypothetical protein WMY93_034034, partial [Mugilogobius chulae]